MNGRQRLADVKQRKGAVLDRLKVAREAMRAAEATNPAQGMAEWNVLETTRIAHDQIKNELEMIQGEERFILNSMVGEDNSLSQESFLRNPEVLQQLEQLGASSLPVGRVNLGPALSRDELLAQLEQRRNLAAGFYAGAGDGSNFDTTAGRRAPWYGTVSPLRRPLRLLDILPSMPIAGKSMDYTVQWAQPGGVPGCAFDTAYETPEGNIKPEANMILEDRTATAVTIANYQKVNKQILQDAPGLESVIRDRLVYSVLRRVENEVIAGDGLGENMQGILHTTGIAEVEYDAAKLAADRTLDGITAVLLSEAEPDAIFLNPADWSSMLQVKSSGSGEWMSGGAFLTTAQTLWGVPAIPTTALPLGQVLIGDFDVGASLLIRQGVAIMISDNDQDDFVRNRVTVLGESRMGLAVWQPGAFCLVNLR